MKRYRIISELGKGSMGVVYRAIRNDDGLTVALKKLVLPGHLDAREEEDFIKRFKSEAEAALSINHPGVVRALDCGLDEGTFYIAYELIDGVTLEAALRSGRKFRPEEVTDILIQAAEALEFAHGMGVVHRDISPGNIFLGNDGLVKIADFGVARFLGKNTLRGEEQAIIGTPGYMAPEQITGGEIDGRSDIFALGCVAYELVTGKPAFQGENIAQIIHQVLNVQPVAIRDLEPHIPLALEEIIFRMISKNPEYRYQSMTELKTACKKALDTMPRAEKSSTVQDSSHVPCLVIIKGPDEGARFELEPTVTTIGRVVGDVLLSNDSEVAQQHAWITREDNSWILYDADSRSGTYLNGEKISREEIFPGDKIMVGNTVLEFRGAGGHAGAFKEPISSIHAEEQSAEISVPKRRFSPAMIITIASTTLIVVVAAIIWGFIIPSRYKQAINDYTEDRWTSAFTPLSLGVIGDPKWLESSATVVSNWRENPLPEIDDLSAPKWVWGANKINMDLTFRYALFDYAERFLAQTIRGTPMDPSGVADPAAFEDAIRVVSEMESLIKEIDKPAYIDKKWVGRKNQLSALVKGWLNYAISVPVTTRGSSLSETQTINDAISKLLTGWFTYQEAGSDVRILENAYYEFLSCMDLIDPVLQTRTSNRDAYAIRGLAGFLAARVLRQAADETHSDRLTRALDFLDDAENDINKTNKSAWDKTIPQDFKGQFPSPESVGAQIKALRLAVQTQLDSLTRKSSGESNRHE